MRLICLALAARVEAMVPRWLKCSNAWVSLVVNVKFHLPKPCKVSIANIISQLSGLGRRMVRPGTLLMALSIGVGFE